MQTVCIICVTFVICPTFAYSYLMTEEIKLSIQVEKNAEHKLSIVPKDKRQCTLVKTMLGDLRIAFGPLLLCAKHHEATARSLAEWSQSTTADWFWFNSSRLPVKEYVMVEGEKNVLVHEHIIKGSIVEAKHNDKWWIADVCIIHSDGLVTVRYDDGIVEKVTKSNIRERTTLCETTCTDIRVTQAQFEYLRAVDLLAVRRDEICAWFKLAWTSLQNGSIVFHLLPNGVYKRCKVLQFVYEPHTLNAIVVLDSGTVCSWKLREKVMAWSKIPILPSLAQFFDDSSLNDTILLQAFALAFEHWMPVCII